MEDISALLRPECALAAFEDVIRALAAAENARRDAAERAFAAAKRTNRDELVMKLISCARSSEESGIRESAAVLARRCAVGAESDAFENLRSDTRASVKREILSSMIDESDVKVRRKMCDLICEVASHEMEREEPWPELLPFMFAAVSDGSERARESALTIFAQLSGWIGEALIPQIATLHGILSQCLSSGDAQVRLAALRACCAFVEALENPSDRAKFQDLLPAMLQTLGAALQGQDESTAQEALALFIELAETDPRFVRNHLTQLVEAMLSIAEHADLEDGTRTLATEFLVTLTEARDRAPGMMRKVPNFAPRLYNCLVSFLLDIEDDPDWHTAENEEDEDVGKGDLYEVGQECLDRISIALGPNSVLPACAATMPSLIGSADWRARHAALISLSQIAEGCVKGMKKDVLGAVQPCLHALATDPHPRVRWAAINGLGQLCTDLGPRLQEKAHHTVLPALLNAMDDVQNPRCQAHAAAATVNFSEDCPPECMEPYLDALMNKLLNLLSVNRRSVQEAALTALASTADNAQESFIKYYDVVLPYLKQILINANGKEYRILRAKAVECISLVGMAVGRARFSPDAREVMDLLMRLQSGGFEDDDPTVQYMLQAWTRLCKCLGEEFIPYLDFVMAPLLKSASLKADVIVQDLDDGEEEEEANDDYEQLDYGDKRVSIRTAALEEKATACNMLCCYVDELKDGILPFLEPILETMIPSLEFYFHDDVRSAAVASLPDILRAGKLAMEKGKRDKAWFAQLVNHIFPPLIKAMASEPDVGIQARMLESLAESAAEAGELVRDHLTEMLDTFKVLLTKSLERRADRNKRAGTDDFDEEEMHALQEEQEAEDEVFDQFAECVGALLKAFHSAILPALEPLLGFIVPLLDKNRSPSERRIAICVFDDIFEYASDGGAALNYLAGFVTPCVEGCMDSDADVRQASVYGVGVLAEHCGQRFSQYVPAALGALAGVIQAPGARDDENIYAFENAVCALGKMCEFQRSALDANVILPSWLANLPLIEDKVEARNVHAQLMRLLETNNAALLGASQEHLPRVVSVFADILPTAHFSAKLRLVEPDVATKMKNFLRQIQSSLPAEKLSAAWNVLSPEKQMALQRALSS